jgi:acyl-CoA thioester hydrolase
MMREAPRHRFPIRVYYEDTDAAGLVYYANYLKFAERARTEWLRELGYRHGALGTEAAFAVRRCVVDYRRPARLDDALIVETRLVALGGATAKLSQVVLREDQELVRLDIDLALIAPGGRPVRVPPSLRAALGQLLAT